MASSAVLWSTRDIKAEKVFPAIQQRPLFFPGLGVTLDRAELERLEKLQLPEPPKWIIKTRFANGARMYNIHDPEQSLFMVRPDRWRLIPMSYDSPLTTEYWDDDGSEEYRKMFARIEREGIVLLQP